MTAASTGATTRGDETTGASSGGTHGVTTGGTHGGTTGTSSTTGRASTSGASTSSGGVCDAGVFTSTCPLPYVDKGPYAEGAWPDAGYYPFPKSVFALPIPANAPSDPNSAAILQNLMPTGTTSMGLSVPAGKLGDDRFGGFPTYFSSQSDPLLTVDCQIPQWGCVQNQIHIPARALPQECPTPGRTDCDNHMAIVDQTQGLECDFWQAAPPDVDAGTITVSTAGCTALGGDGSGAVSTHGNLSPNVGLVRVVDLQAGLIPHALAIGVGCANGQGVYPAAVGTDYACPYTPGAYYGARFQLTLTDTQIAALAVPSYDKVIYTALAHYGAIVTDTIGQSTGIGMYVEGDVMYEAFGYPGPLLQLAQDYATAQGLYEVNYGNGWQIWGPGGEGLADPKVIDWGTQLRIVSPACATGVCDGGS